MLAYSEASIYPLRISKEENRKHVINLLLLDTTRSGQKKHYCLINNMRRLLSNQVSKDKKRKEFCLRCLSHFSSKEKLALHEEYCSRNDAVRIEMPDEGRMLKFKNRNHSMGVPFVVYADFEACNKSISGC